jgi:hypothetical protein
LQFIITQDTGRQVAVVKGTNWGLTFVFKMLYVVAQSLLIGTQLAVAAKLVLLIQQGLQHGWFVAKSDPPAACLRRRGWWFGVRPI